MIPSGLNTMMVGGGVIPSSPPEYIGIGTRGTATSVIPPAHESGDLLILQYMTDANGALTTAPTGWTLLTLSNGTLSRVISLAYKIAQSNSEPTLNITSNVNTTIDSAAWIFNIRGANTTNPINAQQNSFRLNLINPQIITGLTTTNDNCLVLSLITSISDTVNPILSNWTNTSLDSIVEGFDMTFTTDNGGTFGMAYGVKSDAGVVSNTTVTASIANTGYGTGNNVMLAINPI